MSQDPSSGATSATTAPSTASIDRSESTTGITSPTQRAVASATAESYKLVTPTVDELGQGVYDFVAATEAVRLDVLATQACDRASPALDESELGLQSLAGYDRLLPAEQAMISVEDWFLFYGSLLGYFCPDKLGETVTSGDPASASAPIEQFRANLADLDGVSLETERFIRSIDDAELADLQLAACDADRAAPDSETFGLAIMASYDTDLTAAQQSELTVTAYSELYGAVVGWFCPSNLPR